MRSPLFVGVLAVLIFAGSAWAAGTTARCRFNYTNSAPQNDNLDKLDAMLTALGSTYCSTTTTSSSSSTSTSSSTTSTL